jgi:hypothetical protein
MLAHTRLYDYITNEEEHDTELNPSYMEERSRMILEQLQEHDRPRMLPTPVNRPQNQQREQGSASNHTGATTPTPEIRLSQTPQPMPIRNPQVTPSHAQSSSNSSMSPNIPTRQSKPIVLRWIEQLSNDHDSNLVTKQEIEAELAELEERELELIHRKKIRLYQRLEALDTDRVDDGS